MNSHSTETTNNTDTKTKDTTISFDEMMQMLNDSHTVSTTPIPDKFKDYLFYDIEVYPHNAFVVFLDYNGKEVGFYHNDFSGLRDFLKGKTVVGFNSNFYDQHILASMVKQFPVPMIKQQNDRIIGGERAKGNYDNMFKNLDVWQEIHVSRPSLKKIEANMGKMIFETPIPFDIPRELTEEELTMTKAYCLYDTQMVIELFKKRQSSYFDVKDTLVEMIGNDNGYKWNTTTLATNVLIDKPTVKWSSIRVPEEHLELVPENVVDLWETKDKGSVTVREMGMKIVFGFGGIHGENAKKGNFKDVVLYDVTSLYPNIMIRDNVLGGATKLYKDILTERTSIKHSKDPKLQLRQEALKLILNSVYGLLRNKYSMLLNPNAAKHVCVAGQIALYDFAKRIEPFVEPVQLNTDGYAFVPKDDKYLEVIADWEKEFQLQMERDEFKQFIQRDVNNYIAETSDGYVLVKGGDVNNYHANSDYATNNTRIVDIAIVEHLLYGKDVLDIILDHLDQPILFQYVLQAGYTYKGTSDQDGKLLDTKVNRVFATHKDGLTLYKKRKDDGLVRYADAPMKMFLWNDNVSKIENFKDIVDIDFYYQLIQRKLEGWRKNIV